MIAVLLAAAAIIPANRDNAPQTIETVHSALAAGTSCVTIVKDALRRIDEDTGAGGTGAVSFVPVNEALEAAHAIDARLKSGAPLRPLECVTLAVKDNIDVAGQPTTGGSVALAGNRAPADAPVVSRLKASGAVVIARTNMAEWAFSPRHTISSTVGETRNAHDPDYVPAGSSGGSASAVARGLAVIALGTDTGNSIRGPSAHAGLVGLRPSIGLVPLDGILPLLAEYDSVGPMVASVHDAAVVLDAIAASPDSYADGLATASLRGRTIALVRGSLTPDGTDGEIATLTERAAKAMRRQGARIVSVDAAAIHDALGAFNACFSFRRDVRRYFAARGGTFASYDPAFAFEAKLYAPQTAEQFAFFITREDPEGDCPSYADDRGRQAARSRLEALLDKLGADVLAYPSWSQPPATRARWSEDYRGDNSQVIVPLTGLPAITVPMGTVRGRLPSGLQFVARFRREASLLETAAAAERAIAAAQHIRSSR